jgi:hypothetical protein
VTSIPSGSARNACDDRLDGRRAAALEEVGEAREREIDMAGEEGFEPSTF